MRPCWFGGDAFSLSRSPPFPVVSGSGVWHRKDYREGAFVSPQEGVLLLPVPGIPSFPFALNAALVTRPRLMWCFSHRSPCKKPPKGCPRCGATALRGSQRRACWERRLSLLVI